MSKNDFETIHLVPFRAGLKAGADAVLIAHLVAKAYDPIHPATSSKEVIQGLLRDQMGFDGLVVSDALEMTSARALGDEVGASTPRPSPTPRSRHSEQAAIC